MKKISFSSLDKYLKVCISKKKFPGGVCWIGTPKEILFFEHYGHTQIVPDFVKMTKQTVFDLASLTKPLATALSVMLLYEEHELKLNDRIEKFLSSFENRVNGKKTIRQLLMHTSGIPAWYPVYLLSKKERIRFFSQTNTNRKEVIYSCLGYIILGQIIEKIAGQRLDQFCRARIFEKMELKNTRFGPIPDQAAVAATEFGNEHEKIKSAAYGDISRVRWRNYLIKGQVHDGNSFYGYDGVAGNAGLFSNVPDLVNYTRAYLEGEIVKPSTYKMMTKDGTGGKEQRGLGWMINPYPKLLSPDAFHHTGFTGTMLLIDPDRELIVIFLTNAIHPKVRLGVMPRIRRRVIEIVSALQ